MLSAALEQDLRWLAGRSGADADANIIELPSYDEVRTFRMGSNVLRVDESRDGSALHAEELTLRVLGSTAEPRRAPSLTASGRDMLLGQIRPWLSYPYIEGTTLTRNTAIDFASELGRLFASLHSTRVFDLRERFPNQRPLTLMETFRGVQEHLRSWQERRAEEGLGTDLLTLAIDDLQSALRPYVLENDPHFWVARRRVLCHGRLEPSRIVRDKEGSLRFVGLEHAFLGDAYEDLAHFVIAARLPPAAEEEMLLAYQAALTETGRSDPRMRARYQARRTLALLQMPAQRLYRLAHFKSKLRPSHDAMGPRVRHEMRATYEDLLEALNGLRTLLGNQRLLSLREVESMGRLIAYEDLLLDGQSFSLAITGRPYSGKTELSTQVADRLDHVYLNTDAMARAVAWWNLKHPSGDNHGALQALFAHGLEMKTSVRAPFYGVFVAGEDISESLREPNVRLTGAKLLDDPTFRMHMASLLGRMFPTGGIVLEGAYANHMLPTGHRHFFIYRPPEMRTEHLMGHRKPLTDADDAGALLMHLDEATDPAPPEAIVIDLMQRPALSATLDILWHLIPPEQRPARPMTDFSGRKPLFQS